MKPIIEDAYIGPFQITQQYVTLEQNKTWLVVEVTYPDYDYQNQALTETKWFKIDHLQITENKVAKNVVGIDSKS